VLLAKFRVTFGWFSPNLVKSPVFGALGCGGSNFLHESRESELQTETSALPDRKALGIIGKCHWHIKFLDGFELGVLLLWLKQKLLLGRSQGVQGQQALKTASAQRKKR
jgi:hypothetical protein